MNLISRRMATRASTQQLDALHVCNGIANRIDAAIVKLWKRLLRLLVQEQKRRELNRQLVSPVEFRHQLAALVHEIAITVHAGLHKDFHRLAVWGHKSAARTLAATLPLGAMKGIAGRTFHRRFIGQRIAEERLTFPDVRQTGDVSCGAAAWLAVVKYFGVGPGSEREAMRIVRTDRKQGTRVVDIVRAAKAVGLTVRRTHGPRQLAAFVRAGWPVICPIQQGPRQEREQEDAGHYVIALRVGKRFVRVHDPIEGRRWIRWKDFIRDWHDQDSDGRRYEQVGLAFTRPTEQGCSVELMEAEQPGAILLKLGLGGQLQATDSLGRLREPVRNELSDAQQRELLGQLLFPPLSVERIAAILQHPIGGSSWEQDLSQATKLAAPDIIGNILAQAFAAGKQPREVEKLLRPAVQEVKSSARRIARTYGVQIAHRAQLESHAAVADMIVGWQVHAVLDHATRPWHAHRSGTIYYEHPGPGQKGLNKMPHPPLEADDATERPPGTPHMAWS